MVFDPATAYAADYLYMAFVEGAQWERPTEAGTITQTGLKARWNAIDTPDLVSMAAGLGLSTNAAAVVVWEPKPSDVAATDWEPTFDPKPGHILRKEAGGDEAGEGWVVITASKSPFKAQWELLCDKEVTNA